MAFPIEFVPVDILVVVTLIFLEGVLSFDNAAILAAMVRRLPEEQRRKALLYGLLGAYVFRTLAIVAAVAIIKNPWLQVLGASYLIFLAVKHFIQLHRHGALHAIPAAKLPWLSTFWSTVVLIELTDVAFALDQIVAAVGFTQGMPHNKQVVLVVGAAMVAILLLRVGAFYMTRLMAWFPALEHIAYVVVGLVGVKILVEHYLLHEPLPELVVAPATVALFVVPILAKVVIDRRRPAAPTAPPEATR